MLIFKRFHTQLLVIFGNKTQMAACNIIQDYILVYLMLQMTVQ